MRLIDADKLHPDCMTKDGKLAICQSQLANAQTVELTETEVQEILNKRCMTAVANEYLIALHCKNERPKGEWIGGEIGHCSICGSRGCASDIWNECKDGMYCPNCGADMRKGGAENDNKV